MISLGDIADGLSTIAAGKKAYEETVYRNQLFQLIIDWVQFSELLTGEKEGIVGLLKRETDMKDLLFRAATKSEFLEALQQLGILNVNAQNETQIGLLQKLQQNRFEVGASHQEKILLEKLNDVQMQIQENHQSNFAYQKLLENPIHEGIELAQRNLKNAGIQQIQIGDDGNRSIRLAPGASIQVSGGEAVERFYKNVEHGKTAELKVGIDGTEMSYSPPQLKDVLGSTPYAILHVAERPQTSTHVFLFCIDELKFKISARLTYYSDTESFYFEVIGVSNSLGLNIEIKKHSKNLMFTVHSAPGNLFIESDLPLLYLINRISQRSGSLDVESIENPNFGFNFDFLELNELERVEILQKTDFCIKFLEANRILKAHSIIQEDLPWVDSEDSISDLHQSFSRIKSVFLNLKDKWDITLTASLDFNEKTQNIIKDESKTPYEIKTQRGIYIAGKYRFVEVIKLINPKIFKLPDKILLSRNDLELLSQEAVGKVEILFEDPNAVYSYRAFRESDSPQFDALPTEEQ